MKGTYLGKPKARALALVLSVVMVVGALGIATVGASAATARVASSMPNWSYNNIGNIGSQDDVRWYYKDVLANGWYDIGKKDLGIGSVWSYFNNGAALQGWLKSSTGKWYYLAQPNTLETPAMATGWIGDYNSLYGNVFRFEYYLGTDGALRTGWQKVDGEWHYLTESGKAIGEGWSYLNGSWYYFFDEARSAGTMAYGVWNLDGTLYYFGSSSDGAMKTGWQYVSPQNANSIYGITFSSGVWMYFESNGAAVVDGWKSIDGKWYYFNGDGVMMTSDYVGGYVLGSKADGSQQLGWQKLNGLWRYYDANGGRYENQWLSYNGSWYYLGNDGVMLADGGFIDDNDNLYWFGKSGAMVTGWLKDSVGTWYHFADSGAATVGWLQWQGKWYWFDEDDWAMVKGDYRDVNGTRYYFDTSGALVSEASVWRPY
jgi:glucan-binding YG repeat protein